LIDAFAKIAKIHPDYKLNIYGEGDLRDSLEKNIKSLNLEKKVFLKGTVNNLKDKIYTVSLFILSSNYEGMPNSLMEAMSLGLPVISTDCPCGGPKFLIENNINGVLVPVGDKKKLEKAMNRLLSNPNIANELGKNANNICSFLEPNKIYKKWEEYIEKIIK